MYSSKELLTWGFAEGPGTAYSSGSHHKAHPRKEVKYVEFAQGKAIADAAAQTSTLEHLFWSALPDPVNLSGGQFLNVHRWKSKSLMTDYIHTKQPALWARTTTILFPSYFENCLTTLDRYLPVSMSAR